MILLSFRTRVIVVTTLSVFVTIAAVMALAWSRVLQFETDRLDDRLCMELRRLGQGPDDRRNLARLEADLMAKLRLTVRKQLMFRVESSQGKVMLVSLNWPENMELDGPAWRPVKRVVRAGPEGFQELLPKTSPRPQQLQQALEPKPKPEPENTQPPNDRPPSAEGGPAQACSVGSFSSQGASWRAALSVTPDGRKVLAADLAATQNELRSTYNNALTRVFPLALLLTALSAWLLSFVTMRPVNRLRMAMKAMTPSALSERLPVQGEAHEFKELITAYNTMLERLELSFRQASRFSSDAAHELQTPLTILQGSLEKAFQSNDPVADKSAQANMLDEVSRLSAITRKLLLLSQADAGRLALPVITPIDLSAMLVGLVQDLQILAQNCEVSSQIEPSLCVHGDPLLMAQLFNNLVSNAVRYGAPGGPINVSAQCLPDGIEVIFTNASAVITAEVRAQFFDRFYRGDAAHNRKIEGSGLGLSLAREIARAHGGDLALAASALDQVCMRLWLPQTKR